MKFGAVPVARAEGAISAHSVRHSQGVIRKGQVLLAKDIEVLANSGIREIVVARLEKGDVHEDKAATLLAEALGGANLRLDPAATGRVNLFERCGGIFQCDASAITRLNRIDEAITLASLPPFARVGPEQMVATVKIIPYAVRERTLERALSVAKKYAPMAAVAPFRARRVGVVATRVEGTSDKMLEKTRRVLDQRLTALGSVSGQEIRCRHEAGEIGRAAAALAASGHDLIVIFGASAIIDRRDMVPAGIRAAGGVVEDFGMPVDPGNLLLIGRIGAVPVIGAPGCARSPKENGFDWVLQRLLADLPVKRRDVTAMGAGGLLMEIPTRPRPRAETERAPDREGPRVAALVLAAGRSRRMGAANKLLEDFGGMPLVRRAVLAALESRAETVTVVTGHMEKEVRKALGGLKVAFVHNGDYGDGLSTSLQAGLAALAPDCDGVLVCLGDMPGISAALLDSLIAAFSPQNGRLIIVPTYRGKRGNPVLFSTRFAGDLASVKGDVGARHLIGANADAVHEVEANEAALLDVDTPEALAAARRKLESGELQTGKKHEGSHE